MASAGRHLPVRSLGSCLGLTALAALLPGSAFLLLDRRRLGATVLALYLAVVVGFGYVIVAERAGLLRLLVQPRWLNVTIVALVVCFVAWAAVVAVTHAMARPRELSQSQQWVASAVVLLVCLGLAAPFVVGIKYAAAQRSFISDVFVSRFASESATRPAGVSEQDPWHGQDEVNVLLVGGDSGPNRDGTRTDSIIVASVQVDTGNVVLFSLPRNLENAPFPLKSPLHRLYPNGFSGDGDHLQWMLNAVYGQVPLLHPGVLGRSDNEGADALKQAVSGALGIAVDYYAMVDLSGFVSVVDAMGGVTVNVNEPIPIGGVTGQREPDGYIRPGPSQHLDGYHALWFARGRYGLDDYNRMRRQRCLMAAVIDGADPMTLLTRYDKILDAGRQIIQTDIPAEMLPAFVDVALKINDATVRSVVFERSDDFVPESPDYVWVHEQVDAAIAKISGDPGPRTGPRQRSIARSPADSCDYQPVS